MNITFRYFKESDSPIIYGPWLKSQRRWGSNAYIRNRIYFEEEKQKIAKILAKSQVIVACNSEDADHVFGWVCYSKLGELLVLHYAFIKASYQKLGIFTQTISHLCPNLGKVEIATTHTSQTGLILEPKFKLVYNPYLLSRFQ